MTSTPTSSAILTSTASTPTTRVPIASGSQTDSFTPVRIWNWASKSNNGYTAMGQFAVGTPSKLASAPLLPGFSSNTDLSSTCSGFDSETDALMPVELTLTNTTSSFSQQVAYTLGLPESREGDTLEVVAAYSTGVTCEQMQAISSDESTWNPECQLDAGKYCNIYGYIIFNNYYSPDSPNGDSGQLHGALIDIEGGQYDVFFTSQSGPGVSVADNSNTLLAIALDGS